MKVNSTVKINMGTIRRLTKASITALEQTAEALHTEVVEADYALKYIDSGYALDIKKDMETHSLSELNGREYKGKLVRETVHGGGRLQNDSTFVDYRESNSGIASIVSSTPYARRLYFHPEYHFDKGENPNAKGRWYEDWLPGGKHEDFCQKAFAELYKRLAGL